MTEAASPLSDATLTAVLFAVAPASLGGVVLKAPSGPMRDRWLAVVSELLPRGTPFRRMPPHISDDRLLGGLDLGASLAAKKPVIARGLLAEADGGIVVLPMAERLAATTAAHLSATLDTEHVTMERDGLTARLPARLGLVALDEGLADDERAPAAIGDRAAFPVDLRTAKLADLSESLPAAADIARARDLFEKVVCGDDAITALCEIALALGIDSLRVPVFALRVARAHAALQGRQDVAEQDVVVAGRLVLAPRATRFPAPPESDPDSQDEEPPSNEPTENSTDDSDPDDADLSLVDVVLEAVKAALPAGLLDALSSAAPAMRRSEGGKAGAAAKAGVRGRPLGSRPGTPGGRLRLDIIATLRAAAPWQKLRRASVSARVEVRRDDFRVSRFKQRTGTTTVFVVDASGSSAANRLAESKGAVELLLADCYVRRDEVALISFRGSAAETMLPPTRSQVRVKRSLAGLPGGGGTPLASAIDAAGALATSIFRKGRSPVVVFLTDGRSNIARDGKPGVARAAAETSVAARQMRGAGFRTLVVDISPRPRPEAEQVARELGAQYLPLPYAGSRELSEAIKAKVGAA
jgi:magnesium chelatase subunit D